MTYDGRGNMTSRAPPDPLGHTESWTYTADDQVATHTDLRGKLTRYDYDLAGNLVKVTAPGGAVTESRGLIK